MKICYINNLVYILVLFLLALILYNGFMNKINYDKNIEKFYNEDEEKVVVAIDKDGKMMPKSEDTEIAEQTKETLDDVSENTQKMEQILKKLETISTKFNQSIKYNEKIVNEYNKILEDINYISDIDPNQIHQFLDNINNEDIVKGVEILKNIIKGQIDTEPVVKQEPPPPSIENYTYFGSGHCNEGASGITIIKPIGDDKIRADDENENCYENYDTDNIDKCKTKCNATPNCDAISFTSGFLGDKYHHHCCLYEDPNNLCSTTGFKPSQSDWDVYWKGFQTYIKS